MFVPCIPHTRTILMLCILVCAQSLLHAYPLIETHSVKDLYYRQFTIHRDHKTNKPILFEYRIRTHKTLQEIATITRISLDTLISVNRSSVRKNYESGSVIILPTQSGVFMAKSPKNDVEFLINKRLAKTLSNQKPIAIRSSSAPYDTSAFYFFPDMTLSSLEKNTWTIQTFRAPVLKGTVSSGFGPRISHVSGKKLFHKGIDIASNSGSEIFASKSGIVKEEDGFDSIFGNFIILQHDEGYESLYGHLLDRKVEIGEKVEAGDFIATMGSTGLSTGSHIHFEIRKNNKPQNPLSRIIFRTTEPR